MCLHDRLFGSRDMDAQEPKMWSYLYCSRSFTVHPSPVDHRGWEGTASSRKAPHSTLKRIILSHIQMISLVLGLGVPWHKLVDGQFREAKEQFVVVTDETKGRDEL